MVNHLLILSSYTVNMISHIASLAAFLGSPILNRGAYAIFLATFFCLSSPNARADDLVNPINDVGAEDSVMGKFTHSMAMVYKFSQACKNTISFDGEEYTKLITDYINLLYPQGTNYWTLPEITKSVTSKEKCMYALQNHLMEYRQASIDFQENYPDQPVPPVLMISQWNTNRPVRPSRTLAVYSTVAPETATASTYKIQ